MDYSSLRQTIIDDVKSDETAKASSSALIRMIEGNVATYETATEYSKVLGDAVGNSIKKNIPQGVPDDELEAFATDCLSPVYRDSQRTMLKACQSVQQSINDKAGVIIKPVEVASDESRIEHIVERFKEAKSYDEVAFLTKNSVAQSITRGAVNDSIKANITSQQDAGLNVRIARRNNFNCCKWCESMVGEYTSLDDVPRDFWRIHKDCTCTIDYNVGKTRTQISFKTNKNSLEKVTKYFDGFEPPKKDELIKEKEPKATRKESEESLKDVLWDSYLYHVDSNGLVLVTDESIKDSVAKASLKNLDDISAQSFSDTIAQLSSEYDTTLLEVRTMTPAEALGNTAFARINHDYTVDKSTLIINPIKCKDSGALAERIKELSEKGYSVKVATGMELEYVPTHEFAHSLIDMGTELKNSSNWAKSDYKRVKAIRKEIDSLYSEYIKEYGEIDAAHRTAELKALETFDEADWKKAQELSIKKKGVAISKYSLVNSDEFMAEAFTAFRLGGSQNEYVLRVMEIIDKHFKR